MATKFVPTNKTSKNDCLEEYKKLKILEIKIGGVMKLFKVLRVIKNM